MIMQAKKLDSSVIIYHPSNKQYYNYIYKTNAKFYKAG